MASKKKNTSGEGLENVENALSKTEMFIEKNQKVLLGILAGIIIIVGGFWAYQKYYKIPQGEKALSQMFVAEQYFEIDSFKLALHGDGNYPGFIDIVDNYSNTKQGNLAKFYAGISYMHLHQYDEAIKYLSGFKTSDVIYASEKYGLIGDAYVEKKEYPKAINYYTKATEKNINDFTTPVYLKKLGLVYEEQGEYEKALKVYENISNNFSKTQDAASIDKYIERAKIKLGKQ